MTEILPNPARTFDGPSAERSNADRWVPRFRPTERVAHWWTVVMVATALVTGLGMGEESESGPMLNVHVASVVLIGVGIVVALVFGNTRAMISSIAWTSPGPSNDFAIPSGASAIRRGGSSTRARRCWRGS